MTTDADFQIAVEALRRNSWPDRNEYRACARTVIAALAAADRLLPEGGDKQTQHEIDWSHRRRDLDKPTMTYDGFTEQQIDQEIAAADGLGYEAMEVRRRTVTTWPDGATLTGAWETR